MHRNKNKIQEGLEGEKKQRNSGPSKGHLRAGQGGDGKPKTCGAK
jgi:hypothetical protein